MVCLKSKAQEVSTIFFAYGIIIWSNWIQSVLLVHKSGEPVDTEEKHTDFDDIFWTISGFCQCSVSHEQSKMYVFRFVR